MDPKAAKDREIIVEEKKDICNKIQQLQKEGLENCKARIIDFNLSVYRIETELFGGKSFIDQDETYIYASQRAESDSDEEELTIDVDLDDS